MTQNVLIDGQLGTGTREKKRYDCDLRAGASLWLANTQVCAVDSKGITLLELIEKHGSITQAAMVMGISYRHAWCVVERVNKYSVGPVVTKSPGGHSRGTVLTTKGQTLIRMFRDLERELNQFIARLNDDLRI